MPIPVIAGIPILAGILGGLFSALFQSLADVLTKRLALVVAGVAIIAGLTTAFFTLITGLFSAISAVAPNSLGLAISLVIPDNASACVSAIMTARMARWAYEWNVRIIQYKLL